MATWRLVVVSNVRIPVYTWWSDHGYLISKLLSVLFLPASGMFIWYSHTDHSRHFSSPRLIQHHRQYIHNVRKRRHGKRTHYIQLTRQWQFLSSTSSWEPVFSQLHRDSSNVQGKIETFTFEMVKNIICDLPPQNLESCHLSKLRNQIFKVSSTGTRLNLCHCFCPIQTNFDMRHPTGFVLAGHICALLYRLSHHNMDAIWKLSHNLTFY